MEQCPGSTDTVGVLGSFFLVLVGGLGLRSWFIGYHLEGQGDLVSRLITHIVTPFIPIINLLTKSP